VLFRSVSEDECVSDYRGTYRIYNHTVEVNHEYYLTDSDCIVYVEYQDEYYLTDDVVWDIHGEAILSDDSVMLHNGEYLLECDAAEVNGKWYMLNETAWDGEIHERYVIADRNNNQEKIETND